MHFLLENYCRPPSRCDGAISVADSLHERISAVGVSCYVTFRTRTTRGIPARSSDISTSDPTGNTSLATSTIRGAWPYPTSINNRPPDRKYNGALANKPLGNCHPAVAPVHCDARLVIANLGLQSRQVLRRYVRRVGDDDIDRPRQRRQQIANRKCDPVRHPMPFSVLPCNLHCLSGDVGRHKSRSCQNRRRSYNNAT